LAFAGHRVRAGGFFAKPIRDSVVAKSFGEGLMRSKERRNTGQTDLLRSRFDAIIDMEHALALPISRFSGKYHRLAFQHVEGTQNRGFCFDVFSWRTPVSTSLKNALAEARSGKLCRSALLLHTR
jgi:hypothetical protein